MKTTLIATLIALAAAPAFAGEGNGEPFPLHVQGVTTRLTAGAASSQNPFPYSAAATSVTLTPGVVGSSQNPFPYAAPAQQLTLVPTGAPVTAVAQRAARPSAAAIPSTGG